MFDYKQTLTDRLADATDLLIDFATLGEYGLEEPAGRTTRACEADRGGRVQQQESFSEALFPNRCGGRDGHCRASEPGSNSRDQNRGPGRNAARRRGGRGASSAFSAGGAA
jgi:hypothetical protein